MPTYSYICQNCRHEEGFNVKIAERDNPLDEVCKKCQKTDWKRKHCEGSNFDTHFTGSHRDEYNSHGRRKGY